MGILLLRSLADTRCVSGMGGGEKQEQERHDGERIILGSGVNLTQAGIIWEERASGKEMSPSDWPEGRSMGAFS